jgi:PPK2 family polyphosphate:nucleotide phosphotransferase
MELEELTRLLVVPPGNSVSLVRDYDPDLGAKIVLKEDANTLLLQGVQLLAEYQDRLYAEDKHALLVILQAMDAAGKDSVIKHVMSGLNPQGCQVHSFKAPSSEELDHDYLWRHYKALPERGRIGIFNRSYYEEVLVVRVHPEILAGERLREAARDADIWGRRFREINYFERHLVANGTVVVKLFLYVSKKEQKKRFIERIERPEKNWKFSPSDVKERACWDDYMYAYQEAFNATSTEWAPWYVIPADHKWFARVAVAAIIAQHIRLLDPQYPVLDAAHAAALRDAKQLLLNEN